MVKRVFLLLIALLTILCASDSPEEKFVTLEAQLYGKIFFLDYRHQEKLIDGALKFVILYDTPEHRHIAESYKRALDGKSVMHTPVTVALFPYETGAKEDASAYIAVLQKDNLEKIHETLLRRKRLIFVDDKNALAYGMIGVEVGTRLIPLINPEMIKSADIELRPIIFKVAKVWHAD